MTRIGLAALVAIFLVVAFALFQRINTTPTPAEICIASGGVSFDNGTGCIIEPATLEKERSN